LKEPKQNNIQIINNQQFTTIHLPRIMGCFKDNYDFYYEDMIELNRELWEKDKSKRIPANELILESIGSYGQFKLIKPETKTK
jgi:hypothetical protein